MILSEIVGAVDVQRSAPNRFFGVVIAYVEDVVDPKGLGRVKVNIPELFSDETKETIHVTEERQERQAHSYFARIATLMAGGKRGAFFIPERGDEVLLAFEQGDMSRPIVIGAMWNHEDKPPVAMDSEGKNDIRAIYTRSGHKIVFDDSDDKPSIQIEDKTGKNFIHIDSESSAMTIKVEGDLTIEAGGEIKMNAKKSIEIKATKDLTLSADGSGTLKAGGQLDVKSDKASVGVDGKISVDVKSKMISVVGSAATEIKGKLVKIN